MIKRLSQAPVVALLGARQVGKTTLARGLDVGKPSHYLDLERPSDIAKLADPELYLGRFADHLVTVSSISGLCGAAPRAAVRATLRLASLPSQW